MAQSEKKAENYCKRQIKDRFGFTDAMIAELLPEPELKENPHYRRAAPMQLWPKEVVEAVASSDAFAVAKSKADKRREAGKKAAETRRAKTMEEVESAIGEIRVSHPDWLDSEEAVYQAGIEHKELLDEARGRWEGGYGSADDETVRRWAVNFIRHELTDYDYYLYKLAGKTGIRAAYIKYRDAVLEAIAKEYPFLKSECVRQKY